MMGRRDTETPRRRRMEDDMLRRCPLLVAVLVMALVAPSGRVLAQEMPAEYQAVLTALNKKGDYKANVLKVNIPRGDLKVTVDGVATPTSFGFGGWLAMTPGEKGQHVMMGDLVLLQEEVNPVMSALLDNGLEVTALHNHFFYEQPRIFYMHVHGMGKPADLARKVKPAVDLIGTVRRAGGGNETVLTGVVRQGSLDSAALDKVVGYAGEPLAGGTYKYTIGRDDLQVKEMGATINARMGLNTWAAFYGSDEEAVVAGDVAMLEHELTPVLQALRSHGLEVVAIHHHMTGTRPMVIFLHYWGKGRAVPLASGFRAALNELGKRKGRMGH
jgi:hypothetical protein